MLEYLDAMTEGPEQPTKAELPDKSSPPGPVDTDALASAVEDGGETSEETESVGDAPRHFIRFDAGPATPSCAATTSAVAVGSGAAILGMLIVAGLAKRVGLDIPWAAWIMLFLANWIGNGGILVPIPGLRLVGMTMAAHQGAEGPTILVGLVAGFAMALGQTSFYLTAASGSQHLDGSKKDKKPREGRLADAMRKAMAVTANFVDRHGFPTIFTLSTFPNPLTTFATITAGSMGMGFREFLVANFLGHVILGLILALFGQWLLGV